MNYELSPSDDKIFGDEGQDQILHSPINSGAWILEPQRECARCETALTWFSL